MEKYALITGASGGIGVSLAHKLAGLGYSLYLHYNENKESILNLQSKLDCTVYPVQADLAVQQGVQQLLSQIHHPIDTIIYNAGKSYYGLVTDMIDSEIDHMIMLHTTSPFKLIKSILPTMITKKSGQIILISSIWGLTGASCEVLYSMVKGSQNSFVKALSKEVAPSKIRVNAIAPGAVSTNMLGAFSPEDLEMIAEDIPMGRLGHPEEVADAAAFLVSEQSAYITGQILSVNGGWY